MITAAGPTAAATPQTMEPAAAPQRCPRVSLTWLAGFEKHTVEHIAAVIARARQDREGGQ